MAHRLHPLPASLHDDGVVTVRDRKLLSAILELNSVAREADLFWREEGSCLEHEQLFYPPIQFNVILRKHTAHSHNSSRLVGLCEINP